MNAQQEQFTDEISKQIRCLGEEYDRKMIAASQELNSKLAAALLEKEDLETRLKTVAEQLQLAEQQYRQTLVDLERQHDEQLSAVKGRYDQQLAGLKEQHERLVVEVETRHEVEIAELKKARDQVTAEVERLQQETSKQLDQLRARNASLETEINMQRQTHTAVDSNTEKEHKAELMKLEAEKSEVEKRLTAAEDRCHKLEMEKSSLMKAGDELREGLESKVGRLETQLEEADERCRELVSREHDSLQREHGFVVAALQEKLTEKNHFKLTASGQVRMLLLPGLWSRSRRLGLETDSRRTNVSSRSRLEENWQRLGLVSAIYVSCPRPVFGQIVQATLTNRLLQTVLREMELLKLKPGQTPGLTYCPVTREQ